MGDSSARTGIVQQQLDWSETTPSMAVIDAIASAENTEPTDVSEELDTTLFNHVDPEALDALVTGNKRISISFTIDEYEVRFDGNKLDITYD
ncbi:HalOD1 output domain-containing protein [Natrialbaceae archaeon A-arb3/5]